MTERIDPQLQHDVVMAYLEREREAWLPAHHKAQRAGGNSAEANADEAKHMRQIDAYLDELNSIGSTVMNLAGVEKPT